MNDTSCVVLEQSTNFLNPSRLGCIMLSQDPHSSVLRMAEWQVSLMAGFGYGAFIMGVLYVALGLYPSLLQARRDKQPSSPAQGSVNQHSDG